jgi:hypothetical protein
MEEFVQTVPKVTKGSGDSSGNEHSKLKTAEPAIKVIVCTKYHIVEDYD